MRHAIREPEFDPAKNIFDPVARLAVETSHPTWLIERWTRALGLAETQALANANNQPAPIAFRIVPARTTETEVLEQLRLAGATVEASRIAKGAWRVQKGGSAIRELSGSGKIYLQDEASQLVAQVVDAQNGDRVLDLCAAPGSKTTQIGSSRGDVKVIAGDLHQSRLRVVVEAAKLQNVENIECVVLDGLENLPFPNSSFERVQVDAPCSGTGTLRRNPEIRWRISDRDIRDLSNRQARLLGNASLVVKPGGRLVYSTCSLEPEENEAVVGAFLSEHPRFQQVRMNVDSSLITASGALRTWPSRHDVDGFFVSIFESRS
jgi:16S rRNA (cytosine967-C5)-methyltransferase